jgi:hypothetical protein
MSEKSDTPTFRKAAETVRLEKLLISIEEGETITWLALAKETGEMAFSGRVRGWVDSARRTISREHHIQFSTISGFGLKRINDEEIVDASEKDLDSINRKTRRASGKLACASLEKLSKVGKNHLLFMQATLGGIALFTKTSTRNLLTQKVYEQGKIEIGDVSVLFK